MQNKVIDSSISVVGYPKSGNTWLTRLIARSLNISVAKYSYGNIGDNPEIASDVNRNLDVKQKDYFVRKLHVRPNDFEEKIKDTKYVIYIKRDPKAVAVSAFFYFKYHGNKIFVEKKVPLYRPWRLFNWIKVRYKFNIFLNSFVTNGIEPFGKIDEHIAIWKEYSLISDIEFFEVDYNDLLNNTEKKLSEIFNYFKFPYSDSVLIASIEQETFETRKREIEEDQSGNMTFGKDFNNRFLRAGTNDDWSNYLTNAQANFIDEHFDIDNTSNKRE